jgi:hypothetical protein
VVERGDGGGEREREWVFAKEYQTSWFYIVAFGWNIFSKAKELLGSHRQDRELSL